MWFSLMGMRPVCRVRTLRNMDKECLLTHVTPAMSIVVRLVTTHSVRMGTTGVWGG